MSLKPYVAHQPSGRIYGRIEELEPATAIEFSARLDDWNSFVEEFKRNVVGKFFGWKSREHNRYEAGSPALDIRRIHVIVRYIDKELKLKTRVALFKYTEFGTSGKFEEDIGPNIGWFQIISKGEREYTPEFDIPLEDFLNWFKGFFNDINPASPIYIFLVYTASYHIAGWVSFPWGYVVWYLDPNPRDWFEIIWPIIIHPVTERPHVAEIMSESIRRGFIKVTPFVPKVIKAGALYNIVLQLVNTTDKRWKVAIWSLAPADHPKGWIETWSEHYIEPYETKYVVHATGIRAPVETDAERAVHISVQVVDPATGVVVDFPYDEKEVVKIKQEAIVIEEDEARVHIDPENEVLVEHYYTLVNIGKTPGYVTGTLVYDDYVKKQVLWRFPMKIKIEPNVTYEVVFRARYREVEPGSRNKIEIKPIVESWENIAYRNDDFVTASYTFPRPREINIVSGNVTPREFEGLEKIKVVYEFVLDEKLTKSMTLETVYRLYIKGREYHRESKKVVLPTGTKRGTIEHVFTVPKVYLPPGEYDASIKIIATLEELGISTSYEITGLKYIMPTPTPTPTITPPPSPTPTPTPTITPTPSPTPTITPTVTSTITPSPTPTVTPSPTPTPTPTTPITKPPKLEVIKGKIEVKFVY